ncbi:hypothetical protein CBL_10664 [Carabus blaptoides fortunei]
MDTNASSGTTNSRELNLNQLERAEEEQEKNQTNKSLRPLTFFIKRVVSFELERFLDPGNYRMLNRKLFFKQSSHIINVANITASRELALKEKHHVSCLLCKSLLKFLYHTNQDKGMRTLESNGALVRERASFELIFLSAIYNEERF